MMDYELSGKTALVTGSTAGIGFAVAKLLAQENVTVVISGRHDDRVNAALAKIKQMQPSAKLIAMPADLSTTEGLDKLIEKIPNVDILVNNLGIYEVKPFSDITDEDWLRIFNINVMSGIRLSRHYLPHMLKQNWGRIIFVSSESGLQIPVEMIHYGMTKAAQLAIARGLAESTTGTNVTVNSVLPGPTRSEGVEHFIENFAHENHLTAAQVEQNFFSTVRPTSLLKRFTTVEEVAAMVVYLCSPISAGTNGASMRVDGGVIKTMA